jgi:serine kinase of HPr protein (carbohydrate metabolism regulator)
MTEPSSETLHATSVAIDGNAVLIAGLSGSGKSDLALRLIDRGAVLISDDYTIVQRVDGVARASAPDTIRGTFEVRGIGLTKVDAASDIPVRLVLDLDQMVERLPEPGSIRVIAGVALPVVALSALEPSAPIKAELALSRIVAAPI